MKTLRDSRRRRPLAIRLLAVVLASSWIVTSQSALFAALAAPQLFSRPSSGVGRIPLGVFAFQNPGFGDVADAINLASGSVYLDNGVLSRNNLLGPSEDTVTLSGGWHQTPRMRLFGYAPNITPPTGTGVNGQLRMGPGDGDAVRFLYTTDLTGAPSWITRYAPAVGAKFYRVAADPGVQTPEQWLVLVPQSTTPGGASVASYIAHHYAPDGTRSTFWGNSEHVDYSQDLYQQYRSAAAGDPEGKAAASPKTEFDYVGVTSGRLSQIKDEWGRTSVYTWNADNTLQNLYTLVSDVANPSTSWTRKVNFSYVTFNGQQQVSQVTYSGQDGKGGTLSRAIALDYVLSSTGRTLLRTVKRPTFADGGTTTPAGAGWRTTTYTYDASDRVTLVQAFGASDTSYSYGTSSLYGGLKVTVAQGDKSSDYEYNTFGQLRLNRDKDFNPYKVTTASRVTKYSYYPNSFTAAVVTPAGGTLHFAYDARSNVTRQASYLSETANPAAGDPGSAVVAYAPPAGFLRQQTATFNEFNQPSQVKVPAASGSVNGVSFSYADQSTDTTLGKYSVTSGSETFEVPSLATSVVSAGGIEKNRTLQTYDTSGRNTQTKRVNAGGQTKLYDYVYHTGENVNIYFPNANGDTGGSKSVKQYGDLPAGLRVGGATQNDYTANYDALGNRVNVVGLASVVRDVTLSGGAPTFTPGGLETRTSYNAFGQQVWNAVSNTNTYTGSDFSAIKKSITNYYASGEINDSWNGRPDNVTNYRYTSVTSDPNFGRPVIVETGVGANGAVSTLHSNTNIGYDALGRVNQLTKDGFVTALTYDTLDRVVRQVLPDSTSTTATYEANGQVEESTLTETDGRVIGTFNTYDGLGRTVTSTPRLNGALDAARGLLTLTSDPYDRPIKVVNDSLVMNAAGDDRATFTKYDEFGKVIKVLGPALRTAAGSSYTDTRRPYQEFTYDGLQRTTTVTTLLNGTVTPANLSLPSGAPTSVQSATYNPYDQVDTLTDPAGYTTSYTYDRLANVIQVSRQVWKGTEPDYANINTGFTTVTSYAAYDPLQRAVKTIDARGNSKSVKYDVQGNTVSRTDERGMVTEGYSYTIDGLLEGVYQPDMNPGTPATSFDAANPTGYVKTEHLTYGARAYPSEVRQANMNTAASAGSGAKTSYTYDYAGHPTLQTLADGSIQTQGYDARGDMVSRTDPSGFKSMYTYDSAGNITTRTQPPRTTGSGATTDSSAGLGMGLTTTLTYDASGGVTRRVNNGMVSDFESNSLGQAIMATRPHVSSVTAPNRRYVTYRLDGARTAETSYGYAGDLLGTKVGTVDTTANFPSVTSGNVVAYELDARGLIMKEKAAAFYNGAANSSEYAATSTYDGNGNRAKRVFTGSPNIFNTYRTVVGADTGLPDHNTYWKADQNGNMTQAYDTLPDGSSKQNTYTYSYSPTNQQAGQTRDVAVRMQPSAGGALANMSSGGLLMAGTQGSSTIGYNERDLPDTMSSVDAAPAKSATSGSQYASFGTPVTTTQSLGYFVDGHRYMTMVGGQLAKRVDGMDLMGRETAVYDPASTGGAMNVTSSYGADGVTTRTAWKMDGSMAYQESSTPTLGGLIYGTSNSRTGANTTTFSGGAGNPVGTPYVTSGRSAVSYSYDGYGNVATDVRGGVTTNYSFDANNGLTSANNPSSSASYALDGFGRRMSTTGGASDGFKERYSVEGRLGSMWKTTGTQTQANDFRYDPFGRQAITSQGYMNDATGGTSYQLSRDNNSAVSMLGVPNAITRSTDNYDNASAGSVASSLQNLGYSFADGMNDTHKWNLTAPFSSRGTIGTLSAPVKPLSEQLKVNPLDIKAAPAVPGAPLDPGQIKQDPGTGKDVSAQSAGKLQPLAVLPLSAPKSVLPEKLANPLDVRSGAVGTLDPGQVKAPSTATATVVPQGIVVNPIDTTGSTSTDLTNSYATDTAQQSASSSYYSSDSQSLANESSSINDMYTAVGTDASSYSTANYSSTLASSATESSYAHETNTAVMQNVQSIFASRGLNYTPATSVSASEANTAVTQNEGSSLQAGATVGDVSIAPGTDPSTLNSKFNPGSYLSGGAEGESSSEDVQPAFGGQLFAAGKPAPGQEGGSGGYATPIGYGTEFGKSFGAAVEGVFNYIGIQSFDPKDILGSLENAPPTLGGFGKLAAGSAIGFKAAIGIGGLKSLARAGRALTADEKVIIGKVDQIPDFIKNHPDIGTEAMLQNLGVVLGEGRNHVGEAIGRVTSLNRSIRILENTSNLKTLSDLARRDISEALDRAYTYREQLNRILGK